MVFQSIKWIAPHVSLDCHVMHVCNVPHCATAGHRRCICRADACALNLTCIELLRSTACAFERECERETDTQMNIGKSIGNFSLRKDSNGVVEIS